MVTPTLSLDLPTSINHQANPPKTHPHGQPDVDNSSLEFSLLTTSCTVQLTVKTYRWITGVFQNSKSNLVWRLVLLM